MRFSGRDAAVVGGGEDIARSSALRLAAEGAAVVVIDADANAVAATVQDIEELGGKAFGFDVDLAEPAEARRVAGACAERGLRIDVLVNSQMETVWASVEDGDVERWERTLRVNLTGPYVWTQAFLPQLKQSGAGAVVHIGSVDGLFGNPRVPAYSASKGGLVPLTHVMAHEFAQYPVRVNLVCRVASTASQHRIGGGTDSGAYLEQLVQATALRRLGRPEETAAAVVFLASAEASYITGATLVVDGGRTVLTAGTA
jgi:NAD(P)-dependent dehydrogenase (short-subunit alcohol dehydrogenase family)